VFQVNLPLIGQQVLNGLTMGAVYALVAIGLTLVYGVLGQLNWAHGELYMLGGYSLLVFYSFAKFPYFIAVLLSVLSVALIGLMYEWFVFRPVRGKPLVNAVVASLGISIFLWNLVLSVFGGSPHNLQTRFTAAIVEIGIFKMSGQRFLAFIGSLLIVSFAYYWIKYTRTGRAMRAVAQDAEAARLMGVNIKRIAEITFGVGGALTGLAGALVTPILLVEPSIGNWAVGKAFAVVIMGGMGNPLGSIFAGLTLGVIESLAINFIGTQFRDMIAYLMVILVLWLRPQGLFGKTAQKGA
jgi:branched-chain amino acid transport system permease protein